MASDTLRAAVRALAGRERDPQARRWLLRLAGEKAGEKLKPPARRRAGVKGK